MRERVYLFAILPHEGSMIGMLAAARGTSPEDCRSRNPQLASQLAIELTPASSAVVRLLEKGGEFPVQVQLATPIQMAAIDRIRQLRISAYTPQEFERWEVSAELVGDLFGV